jgi:ribosomal protein L35
MIKTTKSYAKRLKVTRNGKIIARKPGQGHFNAKESGSAQRSKRRSAPFTAMSQKEKARFLVNL